MLQTAPAMKLTITKPITIILRVPGSDDCITYSLINLGWGF